MQYRRTNIHYFYATELPKTNKKKKSTNLLTDYKGERDSNPRGGTLPILSFYSIAPGDIFSCVSIKRAWLNKTLEARP